jgi:hypothetical protein
MKRFITFGAGGQRYIDAGNRLLNQSNNVELFDKTTLFTEDYLKSDVDFWSQHSNFIEHNRRGYGYWLWKPYIIKKTMEEMKDGDILLYLDCGCEIDVRKKEEISEFFNRVKNEQIIFTDSGFPEQKFNKMDLVLTLNMLDHLENDETQHQYQGGAVLFHVCDKTRNIVNEWYKLGCDYHNIDDSPSISANFRTFAEHRHDQSIFSLLIKKNNIEHRSSLFDCIAINRNLSGHSFLI